METLIGLALAVGFILSFIGGAVFGAKYAIRILGIEKRENNRKVMHPIQFHDELEKTRIEKELTERNLPIEIRRKYDELKKQHL